MTALFLAMFFQAVLSLGCLVFMRDRKGALTAWGTIAFWFFFSGMTVCLYLIIFESQV